MQWNPDVAVAVPARTRDSLQAGCGEDANLRNSREELVRREGCDARWRWRGQQGCKSSGRSGCRQIWVVGR